MKHLCALLLLCALCASVFAEHRTMEQAQQIAADFTGTTPDALTPVNNVKQAKGRTGSDQPAYYIFNSHPGYVIVSSDEQCLPILGYNTTDTFDPTNLPDGLNYWLEFLKEESLSLTPSAMEGKDKEQGVSVSPLLTSHWGQDSPFNDQVPVPYTQNTGTYKGHATAGCIATALAQIMAYWQYPSRGQGGTYTNSNYTSATVNFSEQTYNWNNIRNNYGYYLNDYGRTMYANYTDTEAREVAKLCYHIGVAVDMKWNTDGKGTSAATDGKSIRALIRHFGYNPYAYLQQRDILSPGAFRSLLLGELQAGHPIPYSGNSSPDGRTFGHYFILDGYDANTQLFHINWGWRGLHNGYFALSALQPGSDGDEAGLGNYNYNQNALIGVQPTEAYLEYAPAFRTSHYTVVTPSFDRGGGYNNCARINAHDLTCHDACFTGTFGLALYDTNGNYETGQYTSINGFNDGTSFDYITFSTPPFNKLIPFGTHTMRFVARSDDGTLYPIHATYGQSDCWKVVVTPGATNRDPGTVTVTPLPPINPELAGISGVEQDTPTPLRTEYYTLSGIRLSAPRAGLIIQRDIYSNGTVKTRKMLSK